MANHIVTAMIPYLPEELDGAKYNHFHEYDEDNQELFEIREITPPPTSELADPETIVIPPSTRVARFRNVFKLLSGKKIAKKDCGKLEGLQGKHATLPRMNKEKRNAHLKDLHDEIYGVRRFYWEADLSKLYEKEDPEPFVGTFPSRGKTVRWKSNPAGGQAVENVQFEERDGHQQVEAADDIPTSENSKRREDNPYWEEEFELPEPELVYNPKPPLPQESASGFIAIDPSDIPSSNLESQNDTPPLNPGGIVRDDAKKLDPAPNDSKTEGKCAEPSCESPCVHVLTIKGIQANLGQEIADLIVIQMILRLGPPLPFPLRNLEETESKVLAIREKAVVQMYAKWAATFTFQKLIVAIKLSLDNFKPSHRGIISFDFQVLYHVRKN